MNCTIIAPIAPCQGIVVSTSRKPYKAWLMPKFAGNSDTTNTRSSNELLQNISVENGLEKFNFEIYPNPTDGNFSIDIKSKELSPYSFEIINSIG